MVLGLLLAAVISGVLLVDFLPSQRVILDAGDVSRIEILAPYDLTYESAIRTKQAQDIEAASVADVYERPDISVARQQEIRARQILDYVSTVREDPYASGVQQISWVAAIPDLDLPEDVISQAMALDDEAWQETRDETVRVLGRAMQNEIRDDRVASVRRTLPTLIDHNLSA